MGAAMLRPTLLGRVLAMPANHATKQDLEAQMHESEQCQGAEEGNEPADRNANTKLETVPQKLTRPSPATSVSTMHLAGLNALIGISIHSIIEAFAVGTISGKSDAAFMLLVFSIAIHKFFENNAIFSPFLAVLDKRTWWFTVIGFSFVTPIGLLAGMLTASSVEHEVSAFLQCFAAGTLVAVGINHMLMPALAAGTQWQVLKVVAAFLTATFLTILPVVFSSTNYSLIGGAIGGIGALVLLCVSARWALLMQRKIVTVEEGVISC